MGENVVEVARRVVARHQHEEVDGVLLDAFSAGAIVAVADALSAENLARLEAMSVTKAASVCMQLVTRKQTASEAMTEAQG
jgi:hypothetical protein